MQIGVVTPRYPPNIEGGGEVSVQMLAEQLDDADRVDRAVVLSFDGRVTETVNGVEVRRLRDLSPTLTEWQNIRACPPLATHIDSFDLIHAYNMELHPAVGLLSRWSEVPTVATLNSYHFLRKSVSNTSVSGLERLYELVGYPTTGRVLRRLTVCIDRFIAISSAVKRIYVEHGLEAERVDVVPNMYDPSFSTPGEIPEETANSRTMVLYVGELSERKGVEYLIRSLQSLDDSYRLRLVGNGDAGDSLRRLTERLGLTSRVDFADRVPYDRVGAQYAMADVFVHPGVWPEPFGRTVMEAMQASLPVVCTEVGGPADIVPDPKLRCPPRDPAALATAIQRAFECHQRYGERNRAHIEQEFSPSSVTDAILDVYELVM
jgi:glycosyltransferase involved in cell wall biosynthesis